MKIIYSTLFVLALFINTSSYATTSSIVVAHFTDDCLVSGHKVYVTKSTDDTTWWKLELLRNAKQTIEMATGYAGGEVFLKVLATLEEQLASNPNIQIHLMISQNSGLLSDGEKRLLVDLGARYPNNLHYQVNNPTGLMMQAKGVYVTENHMKLIVIDEKYYLLGGTNLIDNQSHGKVDLTYKPERIQDAFLPRASCDMDVVISGPTAKRMREEFFQIYELFKSGKSLKDSAGSFFFENTGMIKVMEDQKAHMDAFENNPEVVEDAKIYALISGPRFQNHEIGNLYEHYIKNAQMSIDLAHMYFFPIEDMFHDLIESVNRGVKMSVITNGTRMKTTPANASFATYAYINRGNYVPVMFGKEFKFWQKNDVKKMKPKDTVVYEYNVDYTLFHKKVMVVDRQISMIGSYNLGKKSENSDFEVEVVIDSAGVAAKILDVLENDKLSANKITVKQAIDWHFSFFYNLVKAFESFFFDGIILSVDQIPQESDYDFRELDNKGFQYHEMASEPLKGFNKNNFFVEF